MSLTTILSELFLKGLTINKKKGAEKPPNLKPYYYTYKELTAMKNFVAFIITIFDLMGSAMLNDTATPMEKSDRLCGIDRI